MSRLLLLLAVTPFLGACRDHLVSSGDPPALAASIAPPAQHPQFAGSDLGPTRTPSSSGRRRPSPTSTAPSPAAPTPTSDDL